MTENDGLMYEKKKLAHRICKLRYPNQLEELQTSSCVTGMKTEFKESFPDKAQEFEEVYKKASEEYAAKTMEAYSAILYENCTIGELTDILCFFSSSSGKKYIQLFESYTSTKKWYEELKQASKALSRSLEDYFEVKSSIEEEEVLRN